MATRITELDRGILTDFIGNFTQYQVKKEELIAVEETHAAKFDKFLAQEEVWIRQGIKARRTRNEGRVRRLEALRLDRAARRERQGNVKLNLDAGERSGKLVAELENVSKAYGNKTLISNFSTRILRGDKIGLLGPNGIGKTTLLKLILGDIEPDSGKVERGTKINVAYFDQMREQLDEEATLADTISPVSYTHLWQPHRENSSAKPCLKCSLNNPPRSLWRHCERPMKKAGLAAWSINENRP